MLSAPSWKNGSPVVPLVVAADSIKTAAYMRWEPTPRPAARYDRDVIWEPFVLALVLGLIVSAGLYFAYLWPSVEPQDDEPTSTAPDSPTEPGVIASPDAAFHEASPP